MWNCSCRSPRAARCPSCTIWPATWSAPTRRRACWSAPACPPWWPSASAATRSTAAERPRPSTTPACGSCAVLAAETAGAEARVAALALRQLVHHPQPRRQERHEQQLGHPVARLAAIGDAPEVDQHHLQLPAVVRIDRPGTVGAGDAATMGLTGA